MWDSLYLQLERAAILEAVGSNQREKAWIRGCSNDIAPAATDKAEITLIKGKLEDIELPVKSVDIIISEVSFTSHDLVSCAL